MNGRVENSLNDLASYFQVHHIFAVCSGRAALWAILRGLQSLKPERDVVAVPAYTCFSVPASIVRAGLEIHPIEVDPATLDFELAELEGLPDKRLLCLVTSNLFGLVNDVPRIYQMARAKGAFLVDDAAQALGASRAGHLAGTLGDVGFYSFARGKALVAIEGGIIVTNSEEIASAIAKELAALPANPGIHSAWLCAQMVAYAVLLNPRLYWIPNSLPFLKLGLTEFAPGFRIADLPSFAQALLPQLMEKLENLGEIRRHNASVIAASLAGNAHFTVPRVAADCRPAFIRFPIIARKRETRDQAVLKLQAAGIGASSFYPAAICDIPGIESHMALRDFHRPQAEALSQRLLTLPTHHLVQKNDLLRMGEILSRLPL